MATKPRFYIGSEIGETDCECPEHLCTHADGFRDYKFWVVIDRENEDDQQPPDFDVYRDAVRARDRLNAEHEAEQAQRQLRQ